MNEGCPSTLELQATSVSLCQVVDLPREAPQALSG